MKAADAVTLLKKLAPVSLRVEQRDGETRAVAMPKAGNRWAKLEATLDGLPWVKIEALDKEGRLLGAPIEDADAYDEGEGEDADDEPYERPGRLALEVMRATMKECRNLVQVAMDGSAAALKALTEANQVVVDSYREAMATQRQYLTAPPGPEGPSENAEMMQMMQMFMMAQRTGALAPKKEG